MGYNPVEPVDDDDRINQMAVLAAPKELATYWYVPRAKSVSEMYLPVHS